MTSDSGASDLSVVVLSVTGPDRKTSLMDLTRAGSVYGDRVKLFDPGLFLKIVVEAARAKDPEYVDATLPTETPATRRWLSNAESIDESVVYELGAAGLLEIIDVAPLLRDPRLEHHVTRDNVVDLMYAAVLQAPRAYAMLDRFSAPSVRDLIDRGAVSLSPAARRRAKSATTAGEVLGKLPSFRAAAVEEVLGIREELKDYLPRFRRSMNELAATFSTEAYGDGFFDDVEDAWLATVEPELQGIREVVAENRFLRKLAVQGFANADPLVGGGIAVLTTIATQSSPLAAIGGAVGAVASLAARAFGASRVGASDAGKSQFFLLHRLDQLLSRR